MLTGNSKRMMLWLAVAVVSVATVKAAPPHPRLQELRDSLGDASGVHIIDNDMLHERGICTDNDDVLRRFIRNTKQDKNQPDAAAAQAPFRILALLVNFSDENSTVSATFFDSLIFSTVGKTIWDYFDEVSFGTIDIVTVNTPSSLGWQTAPQTYAYYVNGNNGTGSYPQNSQKLVEDLVDLVDPSVDFSQYDNDADGFVDVLLVVHAGTGAEFSGSPNDIWSHKWAITPRLKDGVRISSFTVQPEYWSAPGDMTIGVYAHELCHGFGLPDLYDTDNSSYGVGKWCIMATGSWNGTGGLGGSPSHPCAWSRIKMDFKTFVNVTSTLTNQMILPVEIGGTIYRMWTSGGASTEYFLVENRQLIGYDLHLPSNGLLVWHIDDAKTNNNQEWYPPMPGANHYLVALEQADGLFQLEQKGSYGNSGDPMPGSTINRNFTNATTPNSNAYSGSGTFVSITNVTAVGTSIRATLSVAIISGVEDELSLPNSFELEQNYPNPFNPSTSIRFTLNSASNVVLAVYNVLGEKVKTLYDGRIGGGTTTIDWDATDEKGQAVASGVYFYSLKTENEEESRKMLLLR